MIKNYLWDDVKKDKLDISLYRRGKISADLLIQEIYPVEAENEYSNEIRIRIKLNSKLNSIIPFIINVIIKNYEGVAIATFSSMDVNKVYNCHFNTEVEIKINKSIFNEGNYLFTIGISPMNESMAYDVLVDIPLLEINNKKSLFWSNRPESCLNIKSEITLY